MVVNSIPFYSLPTSGDLFCCSINFHTLLIVLKWTRRTCQQVVDSLHWPREEDAMLPARKGLTRQPWCCFVPCHSRYCEVMFVFQAFASCKLFWWLLFRDHEFVKYWRVCEGRWGRYTGLPWIIDRHICASWILWFVYCLLSSAST